MNNKLHSVRIGFFVLVTALLLQFKVQALYIMPVDTVWPGDANGDGVVNEQDILYIGIAWGAHGPARSTISNVFKGDSCINWNRSFRNGVNYNNADCDGDSIVGFSDKDAVDSNFFQHRTGGRPVDTTFVSHRPNIYFLASKKNCRPGDTQHISVITGDTMSPIDSIYGVSFELQFDSAMVKITKSTSISFTPVWLGTGYSSPIQFNKDLYKSKGIVAVAVTGIDHKNRRNCKSVCDSTLLCTMDIVIVDNLSGGVRFIQPKIKNLTALTTHEYHLKFNAIDSSSFKVTPWGTGTNENYKEKPIKVERYLDGRIRFITDYTVSDMRVVNTLGQTVQLTRPGQNTATFTPKDLASGVYAIELIFADGSRITRPVVIGHF